MSPDVFTLDPFLHPCFILLDSYETVLGIFQLNNGFFVTEQKQVRMHHCEVWQKKFKYFSATSSPDDDHLSDGLDQVQ